LIDLLSLTWFTYQKYSTIMPNHEYHVRSDEEVFGLLQTQGLAARIGNYLQPITNLKTMLELNKDYKQSHRVEELTRAEVATAISAIDELKRVLLIAEKHPELWKGNHP
jgi:hypothetical protein